MVLTYKDFEKYIILNNQPSFSEYTSFIYNKKNSDNIQCILYIKGIILINTDKFKEGLAIV